MASKITQNPLFARSLPLWGEAKIARLRRSTVAVFGLGGVGAYAVEALARAGIGRFFLIDGDRVEPTNINRQLYALNSTVGQEKTELAARRIADINPEAVTVTIPKMVTATDIAELLSPENEIDIVVDAIDDMTAKIALIALAKERGYAIFSATGAGFKTDPTRVETADIAKTHTDPLARILRQRLNKMGIKDVPVVFSSEPVPSIVKTASGGVTASSSTVPPAFGLALAALVIDSLTA